MAANKVVFSSWGDEVIDNRGKDPEQYEEVTGLRLPGNIDARAKIGAFMGWDGLVVFDDRVNIVDMARAYINTVHGASCYRCSTCRAGTRLMGDMITRILAGNGREDDLETLETLGTTISRSAMCTLGEMGPIPVLDTIRYYRQAYLDLIRAGKPVPEGAYKTIVTAPCMNACPAHLDIPGYVECVKDLRYQDSLDMIRQGVILPSVCGRVCVHPCEEACRRGKLDQPVSIRALKRYVADDEMQREYWPPAEISPNGGGKKVAIIGAGPAGVAAAYKLRLKGYRVTIFETLPVPGGMAAVGIPPYRLPKDILNRDIEVITRAGVEIVYNTRYGRDLTSQSLKARGYEAMFIAIGSHGDSKMGVEGEDKGYDGYVPGVVFLRDLNLGRPITPQKSVVIVGGGNVAMDCARSAFRLAFEEVHLIYRRTRAEMPANEEEIEEAEKEGIQFHYLTNPTKLIAKDAKIVGVEMIRMELGEPDASGRRAPVPVKGSEFMMDCDVVIPAVGQTTEFEPFKADGVEVSRRGTIVVDPDSLQTNVAGVFAGGDCVTGPRTLIEALAAGNEAACAIDLYLHGEKPQRPDSAKVESAVKSLGSYSPREDAADSTLRERRGIRHLPVHVYEGARDVGVVGGRERPHQPMLAVAERLNFDEVEFGYPGDDALSEAERCLRCYRVALVATSEG